MENKKGNFLFTSESVTEGHPDKIADRISDSVLDAILEKDKDARVACEVMVTTGVVYVAGEITTDAYVDIPKIVRETLKEIGYTDAEYGFDAETCAVITSIDAQSPDIAGGVDTALEVRDTDKKALGAGDQGLMFGYATDETDEYMPLPLVLSHKLTKRLTEYRRELEKEGVKGLLRPDGKSQVTVEYQDNKPKRVDTVVVSIQHAEEIDQDELTYIIKESVIKQVIPQDLLDENTKYYINPSGKFVLGGPKGDVGLTGRKIIVDTYGGWARHGGGAFSGKDATKVDRSASYAARYVAKNIVAAKLAKECEVQLAYAIGVAEPVSVYVNTFGTGIMEDTKIADMVKELFNLDTQGIIEMLGLQNPVYKETSSYGHFGREEFSWERVDKRDDIKEYYSRLYGRYE